MKRSTSPYTVLAALIVIAILLSAIRQGVIPNPVGTGTTDRPDHGPTGSTPPGTSAHRPSTGQAEQAIRALQTTRPKPATSPAGYTAARFPTWLSATQHGWHQVPRRTGCDAREATLFRDGSHVHVNRECEPVAGRWIDPYSGRTVTDPHRLDIDHRVPKKAAWISGASAWSDRQRADYANSPDVLLAASATTNRSKGDSDPSQWHPPNRADWCSYGYDWWRIKHEYGLWFTSRAEVSATLSMVRTCRRAATK